MVFENKGTFQAAVLKTWPLELRTKTLQVPVYTEDTAVRWAKIDFFSLKIRKQYEVGIENMHWRKGKSKKMGATYWGESFLLSQILLHPW